MTAMTMAEANKEIRKRRPGRKVSIWAWVRSDLPIEGKPGRVFTGLALVHINQSQAIKLVKDLLGDILESRGGRVEVTVDEGTDGWCFINIG